MLGGEGRFARFEGFEGFEGVEKFDRVEMGMGTMPCW